MINEMVLYITTTDMTGQKQPFADVLQYRYFLKNRKIHRKTTALMSLFNKLAGLS